jgi:hypothetical protein
MQTTALTCMLYSGYYSCGEAGRIGSLNYERQDAATFASWGADYLKVQAFRGSVLCLR